MEGEDDLPAPRVTAKNSNLPRSSVNETAFPASSSSSLKPSSPAFLRNVQAAFKRRRPLNSMQSSNLMPRRIVLPQREISKNIDKCLVGQAQETVSVGNKTEEDASITSSSVLDAMMNIFEGDSNTNSSLSCKNSDADFVSRIEPQNVPQDGLKKVHFAPERNAVSQEMEWASSNQAELPNIINNSGKQHTTLSVEMDAGPRAEGLSSTFAVRRTAPQDQLDHFRNFLHREGNHPMTQSSVSATSISVHATSAPIRSSTTFCSSSRLESAAYGAADDANLIGRQSTHGQMGQQSHPSSNLNNTVGWVASAAQTSSSCIDLHKVKEIHQDYMPRENEISKEPSLNHKPLKEKEHVADVVNAQPEGLPAKDLSSDEKLEPSRSEKQEKSTIEKGAPAPRKKSHDPDLFFKVNGKLYQRLGKIGSGGSSEVHKVISSDCKIYALKKIKLKGRDYSTAYGFCQEILYLSKLKGKNNIIQLIDYEVTNKALLEGVMNGSMSNKDGRVKDDGHIYMVLEYGEIDLAHMLSQKWKEMEILNTPRDENWLRFYWQQILQAVNTIHEERIVHSDLKPANFLLVKGSLKLIDFGIAKAIMSDTTNIQRDAQVGTLSYMSPEAFMCNEKDENGNVIKCGRPSDIWSLGCILYQMVYGRTPFADYKTFWAKFKVITDPNHEIMYEPVSNPWLLDLMKKCLAWDRKKRWRIPLLLQHPFLVPPIPNHLPIEQDRKLEAIQSIAESYAHNQHVSFLCFQLQQLLGASPESKGQQCKLLSQILDIGSQLLEKITE